MKRNQKNPLPAKDTPATRKRRLQARLKEISDRGEQEMANLRKSLDKVRASFRSSDKR